jgi:hypothetical protein
MYPQKTFRNQRLKYRGISGYTKIKHYGRKIFSSRLFLKFISVDTLVVTKLERSMSITVK